jgi:hypothetical protein
MKLHKVLAIHFIMVLLIVFSGCEKKSDFTEGKWNGNAYENSWLNIKFVIPQDWNIASQETIDNIMEAGAELINIEGATLEELKASNKLKSVYAFMVSDPNETINVQFLFENLALSPGGTKYTESQYLDLVTEMLLKQEALQYTFVEKNDIEIAGKKFAYARLSLFGGVMFQEYYCFKKDEYMAIVLLSYMPEQENLKKKFIADIGPLK